MPRVKQFMACALLTLCAAIVGAEPAVDEAERKCAALSGTDYIACLSKALSGSRLPSPTQSALAIAALPDSEAISVAQRAISQLIDHQCVRVSRLLRSGAPDATGRYPILIVANTRCIPMGVDEHKILVLATRNASDSRLGGWNASVFKSELSGRFSDPAADAIALQAEGDARSTGRRVPGSMESGPQQETTSRTTGVTWQVHLANGAVSAIMGRAPVGMDMADPTNDARIHGEACRLGIETRASLGDDGRLKLRPAIVLSQNGKGMASSPLDDCQARPGFENNPAARARTAQIAAARQAQQANTRLQSFADRHGVTHGWVKWGSLTANPFAFVGQTMLFNTKLVTMIAPTEGIFSETLFVGVPRDAFTDRRAVVIVGKVLGNAKTNIGPVEVLIPKVQYVAHEFCSQDNCNDMGAWQTRDGVSSGTPSR